MSDPTPVPNIARIDAQEWCDQNLHNRYPIAESCDCIAVSGVVLPSSFLVDAQIVAPSTSADDRGKFFISSVVCTGNSFVVEISYLYGADNARLCLRSEPIPEYPEGDVDIDSRTKQLLPVESDSGMYGFLVVGTCADMHGIGLLQFLYQHARINSQRVLITSPVLSSVTFVDGDRSHVFNSDFTIQAGDGIGFEFPAADASKVIVKRVKTAQEAAYDNNSIEDAINNAVFRAGNPIRRINNVSPDSNGDIKLLPGDCVDIKKGASSLMLSNPCSRPCCGDTSIGDVREALNNMNQARERLEKYYEALTRNISDMQARLSSMIVASRS